jgi:large subunit ribosomal protein L17
MRHSVFGQNLGRDTNAKKALIRGLIAALIQRERIETTEAKAKAIKGEIDKLVTLAKKKTNASLNKLNQFFGNGDIVKMLMVVSERFGNRNSGFTRVYKTNIRKGDNAQLVIIEWSDKDKLQAKSEKPPASHPGGKTKA